MSLLIAVYTRSQAPAPWGITLATSVSILMMLLELKLHWDSRPLPYILPQLGLPPSVCPQLCIFPPARPHVIQTAPLWSPMLKGECLLWYSPWRPSFNPGLLSSTTIPSLHLHSIFPLLPKSTFYFLQTVLWGLIKKKKGIRVYMRAWRYSL